jgi:hypothetical protein
MDAMDDGALKGSRELMVEVRRRRKKGLYIWTSTFRPAD